MIAEVDPRRVERILRNLVGNAVEHGEGRPVDITLACDDAAVAVTVRDHGVGLKPGEEQLVFNRFWRADPSRARQTGGTGLGLSISVEDARLHGGWLEAWGVPGGGAQFRLTLPVRAGDRLTAAPLPLIPADRLDLPARACRRRTRGGARMTGCARSLAVLTVLVGLLAGCGIPDRTEVVPQGPGPSTGLSPGDEVVPTRNTRESTTDRAQFVANYLQAAAGEIGGAADRVREFLAPAARRAFKPAPEVRVVRLVEDPLVNPGSATVSLQTQQVGVLKRYGILEPPVAADTTTGYELTVDEVEGLPGPLRHQGAAGAAPERHRAGPVLPAADHLLLEPGPHQPRPGPAVPLLERAPGTAADGDHQLAYPRPGAVAGGCGGAAARRHRADRQRARDRRRQTADQSERRGRAARRPQSRRSAEAAAHVVAAPQPRPDPGAEDPASGGG